MTSSRPNDGAHDLDESSFRAADVARRAPEAAAAHAERPAWASNTMPLTERVSAASSAASRTAPPPPGGGTTRTESIGRLAIRRSAAVGAVDDPMERHADAVAESVVRQASIPPTPPASPVSASPAPAAAPGTAPPVPGATVARTPGTGPGAGAHEPAAGAGGGPVSAEVESGLDATRGSGAALEPEVRVEFERALGVDLSGVRVHTDPAADRLADQLGAIAFTRGSDVYFRTGRYQPASADGRRLLAHELAHVRQAVGPKPETAEKPEAVVRRKPGAGTETDSRPVLELPYLELPQYKIDLLPETEFIPIKPGVRDDEQTTQASTWRSKAKDRLTPLVNSLTAQSAQGAGGGGGTPAPQLATPGVTGAPGGGQADSEQAETAAVNSGKQINYFKVDVKGTPKPYLFGTESGIKDRLQRPDWNRGHAKTQFDVDHKREMQLGGADEISNMWLLESSANRSAGSTIKTSREAVLAELLKNNKVRDQLRPAGQAPPKMPTSVAELQAAFRLQVARANLKRKGGTEKPDHWELDDLEKDIVAKPLKRITPEDLGKLAGKPGEFALFSMVTGGQQKPVRDGDEIPGKKDDKTLPMKVRLTKPEGQPERSGDELGFIDYTAPPGLDPKQLKLNIRSIKGVPRSGYVSTRDVKLKLSMFSPIEWSALEFDVRYGLVGRGKVLIDRPPLNKNVDMGILIGSKGLGLYATITGAGLELPGPFKITGGSLGLEYWVPDKLTAEGMIVFAMGEMATGWVKLGASNDPANPLSVAGQLTFASDLFTDATVKVAWVKDHWEFNGRLAIGPGKVAGVKTASVEVGYAEGKMGAKGDVEPALKGLQKGTLGVLYDQSTEAMSIEGVLGVAKFPGIESGEIKAKVMRGKEGTGWSLSGAITARPSIPGVDGQITGTYEDGLFFAAADLGYTRGLLSGRLRVAATNQNVGPDGKPDGKPAPNLIVFGRSDLSLKLTPWLIGTAGVELKPNGSIKVIGGISLPPDFELFKELRKSQTLFTASMSFPVFAGVIVRIGGSIGIFGSIGPGKLLGTGITVEYDPDREDATTVRGQTRLVIPARAGLRVAIEAGLGIGVPALSVSGNIVIGGELGVKGALEGAVSVSWTRSTGAVVDGEAKLTASPMFRLTLGAKVLVEAFAWEVYSKTWNFAAFDYGSGLTFGVVLPVHAQNGTVDLSIDNVRFIYPQLDADTLAKNVIASKLDQ